MRILIANRAEIACRLIQACHELNHQALALYTPADRTAKHVQLAGQAIRIESYLDITAVLNAAKQAKADAIHPGYGFLSENPEFADECQRAGIIFIGPPAEVIRLMGDKLRAKELAAKAGLPLVPGSEREDPAEVGFPLLIKAAAGGGGKGMRTVAEAADFPEALASAKREAHAAFGDSRVFLERLITHGRHIEVQIFGDAQGTVLQLGERDCSVQRRYQKIVEESPAPNLPPDVRDRLQAAAVSLGQAAGYVGPGTVEFLVDGETFYFLEMNTRLQVEHPVTEFVTGIDLAKLQIEIAFGAALPTPYTLHPLPSRGHAIEARIYAEDPEQGFLPATGIVRRLELPSGPGIRNDIGIQVGDEIGIGFDPLLAKLIVWGADRAEALARLRDALRRYCILGLTTNLNFLSQLASNSDFQSGDLTTRFLEEHPDLVTQDSGLRTQDLSEAAAVWSSMRSSPDSFRHGWQRPVGAQLTPDGGLLLAGRRYYVAEDDRQVEVWHDGYRATFPKPRPPSIEDSETVGASGGGKEAVVAPLTGMVAKVLVKEGDVVDQRQTLIVLEAMKMEHNIQAPFAGTVARVHAKLGVLAQSGAPLIEIQPA